MKGSLELIIGNMFSGKTSELIRRIKRAQFINDNILVVNYIDDNRYNSDNVITSHDNISFKSIKTRLLSDIPIDKINNSSSIFIDEAQFFDDLYEYVYTLVETYGKHVVVAGLDGDCNRSKFGYILDLVPICNTVDKYTAYCSVCKDGTPAPFTKKIFTNNIYPLDIEVGGLDKYTPVCRTHFGN